MMNIFEKLRNLYIMGGATLGLMVAGAAPAILFGYSLYHALVGQGWLPGIAVLAGGSLAVTMEVVGSVSAHVAQHSPGRRRQALAVLGIYTLIGLIYMVAAEPNEVIRRTGVVAYLVAPLLYIAVALLTATGAESKQRQQQQAEAKRREEIEYRRRVAEQQAERAHQLELARLGEETKRYRAEQKAARASTEPAVQTHYANGKRPEPAQSQHECEDCGRTFRTVQALNAHGRWCAGVASQNGHMKEGTQ